MWPTLLKVLGGSLLTFALVWALVLGWWQSNDYQPNRLELGLYLAALPLALVGGFLLLRGFIDHLKAPSEAPATPVPGLRDEDPLAKASAQTAAAERSYTLGLIDAFVVTAGGDSVDDTLAALEAGKRPEPSSRLSDESGFPVFAAEVAALDVDAMAEHLAESPLQPLSEREQVVRTLALLERVVEASSERLRGLLEQAGESACLHIAWVVPAAWREFDLLALKGWLQAAWGLALPEGRTEIIVVPATHELDALRVLDETVLRLNRDPGRSEVSLVIGATSAVDEESVVQWDAAGRLFSSLHQQRQIPGEGAVALLLAGQALIDRLALSDGVSFSRLATAGRDKPVDAGGRISGKLVEQLVSGLLDVTGIEPAAIKASLLDTDHRASHLTEALEGLGSHFAHLDPIKDCLALGTASGSVAPIGGLAALACARAKVLATEAPVLCISNQHPVERGVLLAMPYPLQSDINTRST